MEVAGLFKKVEQQEMQSKTHKLPCSHLSIKMVSCQPSVCVGRPLDKHLCHWIQDSRWCSLMGRNDSSTIHVSVICAIIYGRSLIYKESLLLSQLEQATLAVQVYGSISQLPFLPLFIEVRHCLDNLTQLTRVEPMVSMMGTLLAQESAFL